MGSIRSWSFTKFWTVTGMVWLIAAGLSVVSEYFGIFRLGAAAVAFIPAFVAGAWAGEHPEIRDWPRLRIISMWVLLALGFFGLTDSLYHWRLAAAVAAAPAAILTLRWYELINKSSSSLPSANTTSPRLPAVGRESGNPPA